MTKFLEVTAIVGVAMSMCIASQGHAHDTASSTIATTQDLIAYQVKPGDTLIELSRKYFVSSAGISQVAKFNQLVDVDHIRVGQTLSIPRDSVKHWSSVARVMGLSCANSYTPRQGSTQLTVGSALHEGALIQVPAGCHTALLLEDSSILRLPSGAILKLSTLRKNGLEKTPEIRLELASGRVELDVMKERTLTTPFEIRTPRSVMGVRGTQFRVGFSKETQGSLVEVTEGTVKTRGDADSDAVELTQGMGVTIDRSGNASAPEHLLPAPRFASFTSPANKVDALSVQLHRLDNAASYQADMATTANLSGLRQTQLLPTPEFQIDRLISQAMFYQVTAISNNGLSGAPAFLGFCAAPLKAEQARCSAVFETPLADSAAISFTLHRQLGNTHYELIRTNRLIAVNGKFAVKDLHPGHYNWSLSYPLAKNSADQAGVHQTGAFELIALPTAAQ